MMPKIPAFISKIVSGAYLSPIQIIKTGKT